MSIEYARTGNVRLEEPGDPRACLVREKYFSLRPKPLEQWLWRRRVSATAERVFWFHWTEGARSGDWCSQVALHYVAQYCEIDASTVTRAYQSLKRLGLLRRTDPGRDPRNRFQQATAVTEVLIPRELAAALSTFPNRPRVTAATVAPASPKELASATPQPLVADKPANPYAHLNVKEQRARVQGLAQCMSEPERQRWHAALCGTNPRLEFDSDTEVPQAIQAEILQYLASRPPTASPDPVIPARAPTTTGPRRLGIFELARMRRALQRIVGIDEAAELSRQVLWAVEEGALRKFSSAHAINIALKKLRENQWSRPKPNAAELGPPGGRARMSRDLQSCITNKDLSVRSMHIKEITAKPVSLINHLSDRKDRFGRNRFNS